MKPVLTLPLPLALAVLAVLPAAAAATTQAQSSGAIVWIGDGPYRSAANLPTGFYLNDQAVLLENFEDRLVDASLAPSRGSLNGIGIIGNGANSVDGDDGATDDSGLNGVSWTANAPASEPLRFSFKGTKLPTAFGLVVTAAGFSTRFSAYDDAGQRIALTSVDLLVQNTGIVTGDRFIGVQYAQGIRAIEVSFEGGWIDVDHVQYGQMATSVPEPGSWALMLGGGLLLARRLARRGR